MSLKTNLKNCLALSSVVIAFICFPIVTHGQSGTKSRTGSSTVQRSRSKTAAPNTALQGYCAVCIIDSRKWVRGSTAFASAYDGKTYYFPGAEQKKKFDANPVKYVPALGGDCVVCLKDIGKRVPGSVQHAALHEGRMFLFPNAQIKQKFMKNAKRYADVDLALDGRCTVCKVEMKKDVDGKAEFAVMKNGMRYLFPGEKQMKMFVANPGKYTSAGMPKGSGKKATDQGSSNKKGSNKK